MKSRKTVIYYLVFTLCGFGLGYFFAYAMIDISESQDMPHETETRIEIFPNDNEKLDDLNKKLKLANQKIRNLKELNESLSNQIARMNLPLAADLTYPDLMKKIDTLPDYFIREQLQYLFNEKDLSGIDDIKTFTKSLVDVALQEQNAEPGTLSAYITFSKSPIQGNQMIDGNVELNQYDTVFAHISSDSQPEKVIFKWHNTTTGEVLTMKQVKLESNYVWLRPATGWKTGTYRVSLHSLNDDATLIASNSYNVTDVTTSESKQVNQQIIQELVANGKAIPKSVP